MTDKHDEKAPGVTLLLTSASLSLSKSDPSVSLVDIKLHGSVRDQALWEVVTKKFQEGVRIYTEPDFHRAVIGSMRDELEDLEKKCANLTRRVARAEDEARQAREELEVYKKPFVALGQALRKR